MIEHGDAGVLVFQVISTAQIERLNLTPLVLIRDENGWAISPGVTTGGNYAKLDEGKRGRQEEVGRRFEEQKDELTRKATTELLSRFVEASAQEGKVVGEQEAGQLVRKIPEPPAGGKTAGVLRVRLVARSERGRLGSPQGHELRISRGAAVLCT